MSWCRGRRMRRAASMSAATPNPNLVALGTIVRREVNRILRIWGQTLMPPAITMTLYFLIFGGLIGSRVGQMDGIRYMDFIVPGLVMMSVIQNSYGNISSSFFGKVRAPHRGLLVSPMPNWVILGGYVARRGAATRADGRRHRAVRGDAVHQGARPASAGDHRLGAAGRDDLLAGRLRQRGLRQEVRRHRHRPGLHPHPLTYLGGVFYSVKLLPGWAEAATLNPIFYMVNAFRYGLLGVSDVPLWLAFALMLGFVAALAASAVAAQARRGDAQLGRQPEERSGGRGGRCRGRRHRFVPVAGQLLDDVGQITSEILRRWEGCGFTVRGSR